MNRIYRAWSALAPKLIAFLATGLTVSGVLAAAQYLGPLIGVDIQLDPALVALGVGGVSTLAAYIQRDNLLSLPWDIAAPKVVAFALSSISVTGVTIVAAAFNIDLTPYAPLVAIAVTVAGTIAGYIKSDASAR